MKIKKITLVQLDCPLPDYFTQSHPMPRYGFILIGTILKNAGYDVKIYVENIKKPDWGEILTSDAICFFGLGSAAKKIFSWAKTIKQKEDIPLIIGGTAVNYMVKLTLHYFDFIVEGEGDQTILELLKALKEDKEPNDVTGLYYKKQGQVKYTGRREQLKTFETVTDCSLIQGYQQLTGLRKKGLVNFIQFSRGCRYNCKFCVVREMFGPGHRTRSIETTIKDIKDKLKYSKLFLFVDNDFFGNRKKAKQLLQAMIDEKIKGIFYAYATIDIAQDPELLKLAKKAGIKVLILGIESLNNAVLKDINKHQTEKQINEAVKIISKHKIGIYGSFVVGTDQETKQSLQKIAPLANKYNFYHICLFNAVFNNADKSQEPIPLKRALTKNTNYFNGCYVCLFPKKMKPSTLQKTILNTYQNFFSNKNIIRRLLSGNWYSLYYLIFYKLTMKPVLTQMENYLKYLEKIEQGFYDKNENLIEEKLPLFNIDSESIAKLLH